MTCVHVLVALLRCEVSVRKALWKGELDDGVSADPAGSVEEEVELGGVAHQVSHRLLASFTWR